GKPRCSGLRPSQDERWQGRQRFEGASLPPNGNHSSKTELALQTMSSERKVDGYQLKHAPTAATIGKNDTPARTIRGNCQASPFTNATPMRRAFCQMASPCARPTRIDRRVREVLAHPPRPAAIAKGAWSSGRETHGR